MGIDVPELCPWSLDVRVNVSGEGEDVKDGRVDSGVDVSEVVEATVILGRNLPSGPLL